MKHFGYIALGFTIMMVVLGFVIGLAYLAKTFGILGISVILIPIFIAMLYALGRSAYESIS
jgi:hypothetical protein